MAARSVAARSKHVLHHRDSKVVVFAEESLELSKVDDLLYSGWLAERDVARWGRRLMCCLMQVSKHDRGK